MASTFQPRGVKSGYVDGGTVAIICAEEWTGPFGNNDRTFRMVAGRTYGTYPDPRGFCAYIDVGPDKWLTSYGYSAWVTYHPTREAAQAACEEHARLNPAAE